MNFDMDYDNLDLYILFTGMITVFLLLGCGVI